MRRLTVRPHCWAGHAGLAATARALRNVRFALRALGKAPVFSISVIRTMALAAALAAGRTRGRRICS
jgi:hypothetical protein